jgi:hypothetical protein
MIEQRPCLAEVGADRVPGPVPPGDEVAAERVGRCLQRLRQRLRVRLWVRYWLRLGFRFRRRQWSRLRPGFRLRWWRRHWRGHRWRHWRRFHRFGPRWLRLRGFRLRCLTSIWSGLWCHLAGHFAVRHRRLTGTICRHPEMIPSRALRSPRGGKPVSTSCALTCACLRAGPRRSIHVGRTARWHPDRTGVSIVSWTCVGLPGGVTRRSARTAMSGGPGRVIVSWMPCECAPALAARTRGAGHLVVSRQAQGCLAAWYSPRHEPTDSAQVAGAGPAAPPCHAASWRPCISPTAERPESRPPSGCARHRPGLPIECLGVALTPNGYQGSRVGGLRSGPLRIQSRQTKPRRSSTRYPAASSAIAWSS